MTLAREGRCWYCGASGLQLTDEHVLSRTHFGARLVSPSSVCQPCNSVAGRVEHLAAQHPFVAEAIAEYRTYPGAKGFPQSEAVLPDGAEVQVERRPGGVEIIARRPRRVDVDADGTEVWEVAAGKEKEFEDRNRKRGKRVRATRAPLGPGGYMQLRYGIGEANFAAWPRLSAKVALSTMSLVADEAWLDSGGALGLQEVLHERPASGAPYRLPLYPAEQDRAREPWSLLSAGEHVIDLRSDQEDGSRRLRLVLFGYLASEFELRDALYPAQEHVWLLPSDDGRPQALTSDGFSDLLAERSGALR